MDRKSPFFGNAGADAKIIPRNHPYFKVRVKNGKSDFELKPRDYGLKTIETIYQKGDLPTLPKGFENQVQWRQHFEKQYKKMGGKNGDIILNDVLKRPLLMNVEVIGDRHSKQRYHLGNAIMDVLTQPNEVFSYYQKNQRERKQKLTYAYIKHYQNRPVILIAEPDGKNLRIKTIYDSTQEQTKSSRRGVLHYLDRK